MVLIYLNGKLENVAHVWETKGIFKKSKFANIFDRKEKYSINGSNYRSHSTCANLLLEQPFEISTKGLTSKSCRHGV